MMMMMMMMMMMILTIIMMIIIIIIIKWEDLFGISMEITSFNGLSCQSSNEDDSDISCNNKER